MMLEEGDWMEIGGRAIWSVTSAKPGNGVELMRDENTKTFWQSDGHQPHLIDIKFAKRTQLLELQIYIDHTVDESYTPCQICIRAGTSYTDLKEVLSKEFNEPRGWQRISLHGMNAIEIHDVSTEFRAKLIQIAILSNHQNGRDSHVRGVRIFGPKRDQFELKAKTLSMESLIRTPDPVTPRDNSPGKERPPRAVRRTRNGHS